MSKRQHTDSQISSCTTGMAIALIQNPWRNVHQEPEQTPWTSSKTMGVEHPRMAALPLTNHLTQRNEALDDHLNVLKPALASVSTTDVRN